MNLYFAGPLFSLAERLFNKNLCDAIASRMKVNIFLPQESEENQDKNTPTGIFLSDDKAIRDSDIVLAVMDGADADSGTCWEHGRAYSLGKPLICIRTDFRLLELTRRFNLMMYDSTLVQGGKVIIYDGNSIDELADLVIEAILENREKE